MLRAGGKCSGCCHDSSCCSGNVRHYELLTDLTELLKLDYNNQLSSYDELYSHLSSLWSHCHQKHNQLSQIRSSLWTQEEPQKQIYVCWTRRTIENVNDPAHNFVCFPLGFLGKIPTIRKKSWKLKTYEKCLNWNDNFIPFSETLWENFEWIQLATLCLMIMWLHCEQNELARVVCMQIHSLSSSSS